MKLKSIFYFLLFVASIVFFATCANPITPQGGPKDEEAPKIIKSTPENRKTKFNSKEINVEFNEYIQLRNIYKQLLISPPLARTPEIKVRKKSVVIKLDNDVQLRENTTYTFFLGDAVVDLTEGNPYKNFEFVFSTGDFVDSLSYTGTVKDALSLKGVENVSVMLYAADIDSLPLDSLPFMVKPNYVAQTDKEGKFRINNLRDVSYKLFALLDQNTNYLYDINSEKIAFADTLVNAYYDGTNKQVPESDSTVIDTTIRDTNINDTLTESKKVNYIKIPAELFLFETQDSIQKIMESAVKEKYKARILLKYPSDSVIIKPLGYSQSERIFIKEINPSKDTIDLWFYPEVSDTIQISLRADTLVLDTLEFILNSEKRQKDNRKQRGTNNNQEAKTEKLKIESNIKKSFAELNRKVELNFHVPVRSCSLDSIVWLEDSISFKLPFHFSDSTYRKITFDKELMNNVNYRIIIPDSVFYSLRGFTNDSLDLSFKVKSVEDYGKLILKANIQEENQQWIIQLLSKNKLIRESIVHSSEEIVYDYLIPAKYTIKAIYDKNKNGRWDTGNYSYKRQAEKVILFSKELDVRANWDIEESLDLK